MKLHHKPSKARILQISNDISEDMCNASNAELIATVKFWQKRSADWQAKFSKACDAVGAVSFKLNQSYDTQLEKQFHARPLP